MGLLRGWNIACRCRAFVIAAPERDRGPVFIEGSRPVTEEQVRQKLVSDGWTNVSQVVRRGRLVMAMGLQRRTNDAFVVDAFTGRLRPATTTYDDD